MSQDAMTKKASKLWEEGMELLKQGSYKEGSETCADAVLYNGGRGVDYSDHSKRTSAVKLLQLAIEAEGETAAGLILQGMVWWMVGDMVRGEERLKKATTLPGKERGCESAPLWFYLGAYQVLQKTNESIKESLKSITRAIELCTEPSRKSFYLHSRANLLQSSVFKNKKLEDARRDFAECVELGKTSDDHYADATMRLAELDLCLGPRKARPQDDMQKVAEKAKAGASPGEIFTYPNGATVCKPHLLEVCGACSYNFEDLNEAAGVSPPAREVVDLPSQKLGIPKFEQESLNPDALDAWDGPCTAEYQKQFSLMEGFMAKASDTELLNKDPQFALRMVLLNMASMHDDGITRMLVQDDAMSRAITIDVLRVFRWNESKSAFLVRYNVNTVSNANLMEGVRIVFKDSVRMIEEKIELEVQDCLIAMLKHNSSALSSKFKKQESKKHDRVYDLSVVFPLSKPVVSASSKHFCHCGNVSKSWCAKCKKEWYCSAVCQRADWKRHKKVCAAPSEDSFVDVDLSKDPTKGMYHTCVSFAQSGGINLASTGDDACKKVTGQIKGKREESHILLKVQIPLNGFGGVCYCYNKKRDIQVSIAPQMVDPRGFRKIYDLVYTQGMCAPHLGFNHGVKGFFSGTLVEEGKVLRIFVDKLEPAQGW